MSDALRATFASLPLDVLVNDLSRYLTLSEEFMLSQTNLALHNVFHKRMGHGAPILAASYPHHVQGSDRGVGPYMLVSARAGFVHTICWPTIATLGDGPTAASYHQNMMDGRIYPTVLPHHVQLANKWTKKLGLKDTLVSAQRPPRLSCRSHCV